ncbi:MAG TPA: response regulator [Bryobacteraceae bacterium]|nr:response regulator [Bryobacteraceae bacterium]
MLRLLVIEDSSGDVALLRYAIEESKMPSVEMSVCRDGESGLQFMQRVGPYAGVPPPHLVLLDWNLPKMNGMEVLQARMNDPLLKSIPVVVFTSSDYRADERIARDLGADEFITKPLDFTLYLRQVQTILMRAFVREGYLKM